MINGKLLNHYLLNNFKMIAYRIKVLMEIGSVSSDLMFENRFQDSI